MRLIDADLLMENYGLNNATKYGNKDAEQQAHSYSTLMLYEIADIIEDAPTVEVPQWIPCSERLPVENGWYLVTNTLGVVQQQYWGASKWQKLREECVIAWMPLPEAYKGE